MALVCTRMRPMRMWKLGAWVVLCSWFLFVVEKAAWAQVLPIETEGSAVHVGDGSRTREQALASAMMLALEQAVEQSAPNLRGRVYLLSARYRQFVLGYRVLSETEQAGKLTLKLETQVDTTSLLRELQRTLPQHRKAQKKGAVRLCAKWTGPLLQKEKIVEQAQSRLEKSGLTVEVDASENCDGEGFRLLYSGQLVGPIDEVRGTKPRLFFAKARATWQLFAPTSGTAHAETSEAESLRDQAAAAMEEAARQSAQDALAGLVERTKLAEQPTGSVLLVASGLGSPAVLKKVWRALLGLPGVTQVELRRIHAAKNPANHQASPSASPSAGKNDEQVHFLLTTNADVETLSAALYRTPIASLRVQVSPLSPTALRMDCVAAQELPSSEPEKTPDKPEETAP